MVRYRKIDVRMWGDNGFRRLSAFQPCGQGLWMFLLTGPFTCNIPGLIVAGPQAMAEALGWPQEAFQEAFQEVCREGMAKVDPKARFVWIPKAIRYNKPESPNVIRSWKSTWDEAPECALKDQVWEELKAFLEGLGKGFSKAFFETCPKPKANQEPEQEPEQEQSPVPSSLRSEETSPLPHKTFAADEEKALNIWREIAEPVLPKIIKLDAKRQASLRARLKEEGWLDLFREAVDFAAKHPAGAWMRGEGSRPWKANLDYFLRADTVLKTVEQARAAGTVKPQASHSNNGQTRRCATADAALEAQLVTMSFPTLESIAVGGPTQ